MNKKILSILTFVTSIYYINILPLNTTPLKETKSTAPAIIIKAADVTKNLIDLQNSIKKQINEIAIQVNTNIPTSKNIYEKIQLYEKEIIKIKQKISKILIDIASYKENFIVGALLDSFDIKEKMNNCIIYIDKLMDNLEAIITNILKDLELPAKEAVTLLEDIKKTGALDFFTPKKQ